MICALTFKNGRVHFRSRFVQTWQHQMEVAQRAFLFRGQMGTTTTALSRGEAWKVAKSIATGAASKPNLNAFRDPSNTNVFYWGGKLLSCYETCLPHSIDPYTLK